jgi:hypothetical protein
MSAWIKGHDYKQIKSSWRGPFGGRVYQTLRPLSVDAHGIRWTHGDSHCIVAGRVRLYRSGRLYVDTGYPYDGPSGPTWDDKTNMRATCAHDALYALLRLGMLGKCGGEIWQHNRRVADELLGAMMLIDGAWWWRARYYVWAVQRFGQKAAGMR